jgi:NADH-quinone oxidoreductase subunit C
MSNESTASQGASAPPEPATPPSPTAVGGAAPTAPAKPAPAPPPPPDLAVLALRDELQKVLGSAATWDLSGRLPAFRIPAAEIRAAAQKLRDAGYDYCLFVTATDYIKENRFEMVYALTRYTDGREVALVADIPRTDSAMDTVSDIWLTAEWHEREVYDLFGIKFNHHGDLRRILLEESWVGHPLRKDYTDEIHGMIKRPY